MIVSVDKEIGKRVYLARAEQYLKAAQNSFDLRDWDASVGGSIHCTISAQDALCIHIKLHRYKGLDHREAAEFFSNLLKSEEHKKAAQRLFDLIRIKTDAEYGDRSLTEKDAVSAKLNSERFLSYVKSLMG